MMTLRYFFHCLVIYLSAVSASGAVGCLNKYGEPVDWWVTYKYPEAASHVGNKSRWEGTTSFAIDSKDVQLREENIQYNDSALYQTLHQIPYIANQSINASDVGFAVWNDQPCTSNKVSYDSTYCNESGSMYNDPHGGRYAHMKGLLVFDASGGAHVTHSMPAFPRNSTLETGWEIPYRERKFGQVFLCVSVDSVSMDSLSDLLATSHPYVQESHIPDSLQKTYPALSKWMNAAYNTPHDGNLTQMVKTSSGAEIRRFAHYKYPYVDLWDSIVAPGISQDLKTETWCQCPFDDSKPSSKCGFHCCVPSTCSATGNGRIVSQVEGMRVPVAGINYTWDSNFSHAKWAVARSAPPADLKPWVCVGDNNRQHDTPGCDAFGGQLVRGGGAVCVLSQPLWAALSSLIVKDECARAQEVEALV